MEREQPSQLATEGLLAATASDNVPTGGCKKQPRFKNNIYTIMKTVKNDNSAAITSATAAIRAAGLVALTSVTAARATLALVIRDQVAALAKAGVTTKVISQTVREALTGLAKPNTINKALIRAGVRLRGKRNDVAALHSADGLIGLSLKGEPAKPAAADEGDEAEGGDEGKGSGHTVATLAALLASLPESLVDAAVIASQARRLIRA